MKDGFKSATIIATLNLLSWKKDYRIWSVGTVIMVLIIRYLIGVPLYALPNGKTSTALLLPVLLADAMNSNGIPVGVSWSFHPVDKASTNLITALVSGLLSDWIHPNITITEVLLLIQSAVLILFLLSHALTDKTFLLQVFRKVERSH